MLKLKRSYDPLSDQDGERLLVERLWPRGMRREAARLDGWLKELAPSPDLRKWFGHDVQRWEEFQRRYRAELGSPEKAALLRSLAEKARTGAVTLVFAARDTEHNSAVVLKEAVEEHYRRSG